MIEWSNGLGSRGRRPWLLLIKEGGGPPVPFKGESIPDLVLIQGTSFHKNGKWSHTTYRLNLIPGVRHLSGMEGWESGTFAEGLRAVAGGAPIDTWAQMAQALGVGVPDAMTFLRAWRPKAAAALDAVEEQLTRLDDAVEAAGAEEAEIVAINFGSPTRRQEREGYWGEPKPLPGRPGQIELITPGDGPGAWTEGNIRLTECPGEVVSVSRASGHGGGYVTVKVAVPKQT